ncbi:unnamed protein product, partial [Amoebophrya sp. A120]
VLALLQAQEDEKTWPKNDAQAMSSCLPHSRRVLRCAERSSQKGERDNVPAVSSAICHAKFTRDSPRLMLTRVKALSNNS